MNKAILIALLVLLAGVAWLWRGAEEQNRPAPATIGAEAHHEHHAGDGHVHTTFDPMAALPFPEPGASKTPAAEGEAVLVVEHDGNGHPVTVSILRSTRGTNSNAVVTDEIARRTSADKRVERAIEPGIYQVRIEQRMPGRTRYGYTAPFPVQEGERKEVMVRFGMSEIAGQVLWDDGTPVDRARLFAMTFAGWAPSAEVSTGPDGRFAVNGIAEELDPSGEVAVSISPPANTIVKPAVNQRQTYGEPFQFVIERRKRPASEISKVVLIYGGQALPKDSEGANAVFRLVMDGKVSFEPMRIALEVGENVIPVSGGRGDYAVELHSELGWIRSPLKLDRDELRAEVWDWKRGHRLRGRVLGSAGEQDTVSLHLTRDPASAPHLEASVGADGGFEFPSVQEGRYHLSIRKHMDLLYLGEQGEDYLQTVDVKGDLELPSIVTRRRQR